MMYNIKIIENTDKAKQEYGYMWGADTFVLTKEMLKALLDGKYIAVYNGEYVTFIVYEVYEK